MKTVLLKPFCFDLTDFVDASTVDGLHIYTHDNERLTSYHLPDIRPKRKKYDIA